VQPQPPDDLIDRRPRFTTLRRGSIVHRFYPAEHEPIYFDPSRMGRLNVPDGSYGVLYAAK